MLHISHTVIKIVYRQGVGYLITVQYKCNISAILSALNVSEKLSSGEIT